MPPRLYLRQARLLAVHSPSRQTQVGAVLVPVLGPEIGAYNSSNEVEPEQDIDGVLTTKPWVLHAEEDAVAQAALTGIALAGASAYITSSPCFKCARLLWGAGIKRIYFEHHWWDKEAIKWLKSKGIEVKQVKLA